MNTIPSESDSNAILDRLLSGAGLHRDAQLAALLGVSPQAVSQARRKRKIPEGWVVKVSQQCGLSMDWLMFGKGDESTPVASHAPVASSTSQASTPAGAAVPDLDLLCIPQIGRASLWWRRAFPPEWEACKPKPMYWIILPFVPIGCAGRATPTRWCS